MTEAAWIIHELADVPLTQPLTPLTPGLSPPDGGEGRVFLFDYLPILSGKG